MLVSFLVGASVCFASTLPFGPINLTVAKTTVEKSRLRGFEVAVAAALVETFQVLLAVWFGLVISRFLEDNVIFRIIVATVFLGLGFFIFRRRPTRSLNADDHYFGSEIKTGLLVAAINPQAIPFWIIALAAINDNTELAFQGLELVLFLLGVFSGKVLALTGFIAVSNYLKTHLDESSRLVNRALGIVLMLIGLVQWIRILLAD
ncbi:MAG: LysE family transporter [Gammaproteobacteria bacterium]|nr:LysE family transporter [Gammaproteobacteria bacterium]